MDYNKIQPIGELYGPVIQSEGSLAGIPHIVVRTTGCTHRCYFADSSWCDSWYTSIHPEKGKFTLNDIKAYFEKHKECKYLMLTGGSPTMHAELVNEIVTIFKETHQYETAWANYEGGIVTLETEGSHFIQTKYPIDVISLSPKFSNSIPKLGVKTPLGKETDQKMIDQHNKFRINKQAISELLDYHNDYHFKPVCNPIKQPEAWDEIEKFRLEMGIPKNKTWIMPPGSTKDELMGNLADVITFCGDNGYNFSGRDHILAFGDKRGV